MSLVKNNYRRLAPRLEYLQDPVVLALAWKKASAYVRRYNWYADTLELDSSGLDLQGLTERWSQEISSRRFSPTPARLVLAPKNARWTFDPDLQGGWGPMAPAEGDQAPAERLSLRPLAHVGIREQAVAAAIMLCLADCIESAQGNPAVNATEALGKGIFSYGNRLYCQWLSEDRIARFSWGSADAYSRFYADYQQFVSRPREVAAALQAKSDSQGQRVYVIKLDLSSFFDRIQVPLLVSKLRAEYARFRKAYPELADVEADDDFWLTAERVLQVRWAAEDFKSSHLLKGGQLPTGLPQGLMASGFFANAYLLDFDRAIGRACERRQVLDLPSCNVRLHDYCRYVDDLRLVVSTDAIENIQSLQDEIGEWLQAKLDASMGDGLNVTNLAFNGKKTETELLSHVAEATGVASRMRQVQQQLSGPFDLSSLRELETALHGLLSMAEADATIAAGRKAGALPALALVSKPPMDVRDDTLTRFSAYRLCKSLRQRRKLMDLDEDLEGRTAGDVLRQDYELTARRLVGSWAENPSLVQVLRYAFDLFPSRDLLKDVLDALELKLTAARQHPDQAAVAWYVLAELFRAAATETGRSGLKDEGFVAGDLDAYRGELVARAVGVLQPGDVPWYVQQQAALLLATCNAPSRSLADIPELTRYRYLHAYLLDAQPGPDLEDEDAVATAIIGWQLTGDTQRYSRWLRRFGVERGDARARRAKELTYRGSVTLFDAVTPPGAGTRAVARGLLGHELAMHANARWKSVDALLPTSQWMPLSRAIVHATKPFQHENALLRLALQLTGIPQWPRDDGSLLCVFDLQVRCPDWKRIDDPNGPEILLRVTPGAEVRDGATFRVPSWCRPELAWRYALGAVLRAAAVGNNDFTFSSKIGVNEPGWYRGMTSGASRRQLGMLHTSQALGGTSCSVTPWFSELLGVLLRWPGIEDVGHGHPGEAAATPAELRAVIQERIEFQRALFGRSSGSAIYRYPVPWSLREARSLRVAVVQGLLPSSADIESLKLEGLNASPFRARHRNHTAALLRLTAMKLGVYKSANGVKQKPLVDLVVLPEYAIHIDDQDLLRAFSDETGAMLHYGLLGAVHPSTGAPTNAARWLIPVRNSRRRSWIEIDQGKRHMTKLERQLGVTEWCPYRVVMELQLDLLTAYRMVGAICYDATDLSLAADLKNESHMLVVPAFNKDVKTFDGMAAALRYHMYQHVVICNHGEFGGSSAQAPYAEEHRRTISHVHGSQQVAIAVFDVNVDDFGPLLIASPESSWPGKTSGKTPPAGLSRRA